VLLAKLRVTRKILSGSKQAAS